MSKIGDELIESLRQAAEHAKGNKVRGMRLTKVELPDVKAIRRALRMSQDEFAAVYRIPLATPVPSIYEEQPDSLEYDLRSLLIFLNYFAADLARPIVRDDRVHVEYVPTQIVTEYFRSEFVSEHGPLDGIRYRSSRHEGHWSLVLFAEQDDVVGAGRTEGHALASLDPWIELFAPPTQHQVTAEKLSEWQRDAPKEAIWI